MGLLDRFKHSDESTDGREKRKPVVTETRELTDEEREELIEQARSELPKLDKTYEENLSRLRGLSRS